uniref:DUF4302 domain-containing protein n=1 Tax=Prevotella sp. GTC17260 TaxID=3236796 RepID=A0AB33JBB6_9BACT
MKKAYSLYIVPLLSVLLFWTGCTDNAEYRFDDSPSDRNRNATADLRKQLVEAPYGWKVIYFPKTDSLLFSNPNEVIGKYQYNGRYGYGGYYYIMKFDDKGKVAITADYDEKTITTPQTSEFEIRQNSFTQLSFTTYNSIHDLVNDRFGGSSDFLFMGYDYDGSLLFKTASYNKPACEYIVFTKLDKPNSPVEYLTTAYKNRRFFEQMPNPQLHIRIGGRTFFRSDTHAKSATQIREIIAKRYHLFLFGSKPSAFPDGFPDEIKGLGSGFVGTEQGLTFHSGLRYDKQRIFYDFKREGDKFVCELVKVYDPYLHTTRLVAKHLAPDGEFTGYIAEIENKIQIKAD